MSVKPRGFGVAAGLDPTLAVDLAALCQELGYTSIWSNDHPAASGLETLASFAQGSDKVGLGIGALALDRHDPKQLAGEIERLKLEPQRLALAFGSGFSKRPLRAMRDGVAAVRLALPAGVRVLVAAMGPKMCELAGELADGVMLNWMTPQRALWARQHVAIGAERAGRDLPRIVGYVRVAVDERAEERLVKEEQFYRELHEGYSRHFAQLGAELGSVGVAASADQVADRLAEYEVLDGIVVRALASANLEAMSAVATAASP